MNVKDIDRRIRRCRRCLLWKRARKAVPGEGPAHARAMLIGQNPGREEDRTGRPFIGRSGKFLDRVLEECGIDRRKLYITSVVKHVTPKNRVPTTKEIEACLPFLREQIQAIRPRVILLMGSVAIRHTPRIHGIRYMETCHPAAAMRFSKYRSAFCRAFRTLGRLLNVPKD